MSDDLQKTWNLIETFLRNARAELPTPHEPSPDFAACLEEFDDFISSNELGLAMDSLAEAGRMIETRGRFWNSLYQAAVKMDLPEQADEFHSRFVAAAIRGVKEAQEKK